MLSEYIKSDLYRYSGQVSFKSFLKNYLSERGFNFSVWLRLANPQRKFWRLAYPVYFYKKRKYGIDISNKMQLGYGLYIGHGGPLVINGRTVMGNNVNLSQYITIGTNGDNAAEIADNVYVGPGTCIVEQVKIGAQATIGAGSVVTKDIPANATAAGNYAKVLNFNNPGRFIQHPWPVPEDQQS